ncbi:MAG: hypothetical protein J6K44_05585, partial [Clostridia bacterium]|nr:hypothetical protein [Clostridia bacterium]
MSENTNINNTEPKESEFTEIVGINFREAGKIYHFSPGGYKLTAGERVIVDTARGIEIGTVKVPNKKIPASEITTPLKPVTRIATKDDL